MQPPHPTLESIRRRLTKPKTRREEREAMEELRAGWRALEADLIGCLRSATIDHDAAALGYRPKQPRELIWEALLQEPTPARVHRLLFLLDDTDVETRARFGCALAATGKPFVLEHVERALNDDHDDVRKHATYGLRDAAFSGASAAFNRAAAALILDLLRRHPEDDNFAIGQALEHLDPALMAQARSIVARAREIDRTQPFFLLHEADPPWGDYGRVLINGISWNSGRDRKGRLQLERTGPFVPPITFPDTADIVVTSAFREKLEGSGLSGLSFHAVHKKRVVYLRWELWDRRQVPARYPAGGEPENYVLGRRHRPRTAAEMPELFELRPAATRENPRELARRKHDFSRLALPGCPNVVSRRAMNWLSEHAHDWVSFSSLP